MKCKRPGCTDDLRHTYTSDGYCSLNCRDVHAYQQDAQVLYDVLVLVLSPSHFVTMPKLNHTYM